MDEKVERKVKGNGSIPLEIGMCVVRHFYSLPASQCPYAAFTTTSAYSSLRDETQRRAILSLKQLQSVY